MPLPATQLAHPHMLSGLSLSVFTLEAEVYTQNSGTNVLGEPSNNVTTTGLLIPCYVEPANATQEVRRPDGTVVLQAYNIALQGYYPFIGLNNLILIEGRYYNVLGVGADHTHTITFVTAEIVNTAPGSIYG